MPSVPTAMGSTVGTVTDMAVAAGSPSMVPSAVEERVTLEVAEPPELVASLPAAEAAVIMARDRHRAMDKDRKRFKFLIFIK